MSDVEEEKDETQGDSHNDQQEPLDESYEERTNFNVDNFLSNLEEIPASMKEDFGHEDIAKFSA